MRTGRLGTPVADQAAYQTSTPESSPLGLRDSGVVTSRLRSRPMPSPGRMASMHARNQGCRDGPCNSGMERMIRFYFPSPGVLPPNEGPRGGDTCPPPPHFLSGYNMDEHATDRAPGTRVGQRHFLEPSIADTVRADAGRAAGGPGPLRPAARERRLRRRLRRPSEGQGLALDRGAGPRAAAQPRTPRRLRLRGQHRRRRRDHGPDPGSRSCARSPPRSASRCPRRAATAPASSSCRTTRRSATI